MPRGSYSGLKRVGHYSKKQNWRNLRAHGDASRQPRDILQERERTSAKAFVKGPQWYSKLLLEFQEFPNGRSASNALIKNSRRLIAQSRESILRTKNILAFSRISQKYLN
jgi:hypothetical protein